MLPAILLYFIFQRIRHPSKATPGCAAQRAPMFILRTKRMPKQHVFGGYGRDQGGKQTRTVHTPGGKTHVGTQAFVTTRNDHNEAWLFKLPDEEARRQDDL